MRFLVDDDIVAVALETRADEALLVRLYIL